MSMHQIAFGLVVLATAPGLARAQSSLQFPSPSAQACALACSGDRMCAAWSYGGAEPKPKSKTSWLSRKAPPPSAGTCIFSSSANISKAAGFETGLPPAPSRAASPTETNNGLPTALWSPPTAQQRAPSPATPSGPPSSPLVSTVPHVEFITPKTDAPPTPPAPRPEPIKPPAIEPGTVDLEAYRGADGMVDSAVMRRAQLNSAREHGQTAYAVQQESEAIEIDRQRVETTQASVKDPLAGTIPVSPDEPPQLLRDAQSKTNDNEAASTSKKGLKNRKKQQERPPIAIDREPKLNGGPVN
jgi:hypothetical protein